MRHISLSLAILLPVIIPNSILAVQKAKAEPSSPSKGWYEALDWLKVNTPDPFPDPDFYYRFYDPPPSSSSYAYPESAYAIMNWWDYGHWIIKESKRIPVSTPFQWGRDRAAGFFMAEDMSSADAMLESLKARYVITDRSMALGKFFYIAKAAGRNPNHYLESVYTEDENGKMERVTIYHPAYYRNMLVRLYMFNADALIPNETPVITLTPHMLANGQVRYIIKERNYFLSYEEACEFVDAAPENATRKIVGFSPYKSPVPLEILRNYELRLVSQGGTVKIFEFVGK
ncbi:MAG: hypothetical protein GX811_02950 [Lentisphaerae bacterium]|nr:hypothetical protein [Lentisphaerota bacterium]